jgi:hypothetical protein
MKFYGIANVINMKFKNRNIVTNSSGYQTINIPKVISDSGWNIVSACELEFIENKNIIIIYPKKE